MILSSNKDNQTLTLAVLINKKLKNSEINDFSHTNAEFLAIKTKIQIMKLLFFRKL